MAVTTSSETLSRVRRDTLELILAEHPLDCLSCPKNQKCQLQEAAAYIGGLERALRRTGAAEPPANLTPFFIWDKNYCILCQKCVRACHEIVRADIISIVNRGSRSRVACYASEAEAALACRDCLKCVARCPTAALRLTRT
jgi:predicted molibdopterin-dependent oxidoreductase YjgC